MRRNYGTQLSDHFEPSNHRKSQKFLDPVDGTYRCKVMKWYAKKVRPFGVYKSADFLDEIMAHNAMRRFQCAFNYSIEQFKSDLPLMQASRLCICEEDVPPEFPGSSGILP